MADNSRKTPAGGLSRLRKQELLERVRHLQDTLHHREDYITHLERLTEAYENLKSLSDRELKDADQVIQAQEILQELMTQERIHAEKIIHAHEIVEQLSAREIDEARRIIEAQEAVQGLMSQERLEAERIIEAHEIVESLSAQEIEDAYKTIEAHEKIHGLARMEKQASDQEIHARENVSHLSSVELRHRDEDLLRVLEINRGISAILDEEKLLQEIVEAAGHSLQADRTALFRVQDSRLVPLAAWQVSQEALSEDPLYQGEWQVIRQCSSSRQSCLQLNVPQPGSDSVSVMAVPLLHMQHLIGVLYAAKQGRDNTFYSRDLFTAEIFSHQAVISLHNADLYKKLKKQNWELLHLINLKNEFINRMSQHISGPCQELHKNMESLQSCGCSSCEKVLQSSRKLTERLNEMVGRVLDLIAMEKEVDELTSDQVDFRDIIQSLLTKYHSELEKKNLNFSLDLAEAFHHYPGNATIIRAILDELLGNAILYNKPNGRVEVTGRQLGEFLELKVSDTGPGIKPEEQELVFSQFYRSESTRELNESGAGLGLYMVRSFISYYQGSLGLESVYGQGCTFILKLLAV